MGGDPNTRSIELTLQAERRIEEASERWAPFFRKAIDALAFDPEPDGVTKLVAPVDSGYSGCILYEVYPWRIVYQLANPDRLIVVAVQVHPKRARFL
jgi:mRNA-degrading endonuclease RelE of RelBE toxin-antitoxin system